MVIECYYPAKKKNAQGQNKKIGEIETRPEWEKETEKIKENVNSFTI